MKQFLLTIYPRTRRPPERPQTMTSVCNTYKFDELTWPEVNEAVAMGKIPILPTGRLRRKNSVLS